MRKLGIMIVATFILLVTQPEKSEAADYIIQELSLQDTLQEEMDYLIKNMGLVITGNYPDFHTMRLGKEKTTPPPIQVIQTNDVRYVSLSRTLRGEAFRNFVAEVEKLPKGKEVSKLRNVYLTDYIKDFRGMLHNVIEPYTDMMLFDAGHYYMNDELYGTFAHEYGHLFANYWIFNDEQHKEDWKKFAPETVGTVTGDSEYMFSEPEYLAEQYRMIYFGSLNKKGNGNVRKYINESYNPYMPLFNTGLRNYFEEISGVKSPAPAENEISTPMVSIDKQLSLWVKASFSELTKDQEVAVIIGKENPYKSMQQIKIELMENTSKHYYFSAPYLGNVKSMTRLIPLKSSMYSEEILNGEPFWVRIVSRDRNTGAISDSDKIWYKYYDGALMNPIIRNSIVEM